MLHSRQKLAGALTSVTGSPDGPVHASIWPEAGNNIAFQFNRGEAGPVEAAIRAAAHVVECELVNNRVVAAPSAIRGVGTVVIIDKIRPTPAAYPRRPGVPERKPL